MEQKYDLSEMSTFGSELKKRLSHVKDIGEMREIYGDKFVDEYLGTQIGEEIGYYLMSLELEKRKRLSELCIIYGLINEDGTQIPAAWDLSSQSSTLVSDTSSTISSSSSTGVPSLRKIDFKFKNSLFLPTDIASPIDSRDSIASSSPVESTSDSY
uniref:Uncharacterized protein n=1 Tax=Ganoderma sinense TaxID=36075 RepID=V5KV80_9APHY|nr:hypothetical protein Gasi_Mp07 [Ganoderma sinense]AHA41715.1 hypothetical protein Gasi_Mp07 [Ganoderma sinense]